MPEVSVHPSRHPRLLLVAMVFAGAVTAVMQTLAVPLLPTLIDGLRTTHGTASWVVTAALIAGAVSTPVLGRLGDMYGRREVMLCALASLVAGSALAALSTHVLTLVMGRTLQGIALAVVPLGIGVLRDVLPPERVAFSAALMSTTLGLGAALGVPLTSLIARYADWHAVFWMSGGLGLLCFALVFAFVPRSAARGGRFDALGTLGLTAVLVCFLVAVSRGAEWGWTSAAVLGLLAAALAVGAGWVYYETRVPSPIVELRGMVSPAVLLTNLATLLIGFSFFVNSLVTAQLVQEPSETGYGLGFSVLAGGLCMLPSSISMLLFAPIAARVAAARGPKTAIAAGIALMAAGYALRLFTSESLVMIIVGATVVGIGTAFPYSTLPALLMRHVPREQTGAANGVNVLMRVVGQAICSAVVAAVLGGMTMEVGDGTAPAFEAYLTIFFVAGCVAVGALVTTLLVSDRRPGSDIQKDH
ncbi:MFS transporter [Thermobifida halotolerans]|uniref:MFS transporter n=1 Tax=Thermobifida halotolerans TaxID=483545 RepID=UPI000B32785F|nr:MFS transporter [Thermobifida halotolerans]